MFKRQLIFMDRCVIHLFFFFFFVGERSCLLFTMDVSYHILKYDNTIRCNEMSVWNAKQEDKLFDTISRRANLYLYKDESSLIEKKVKDSKHGQDLTIQMFGCPQLPTKGHIVIVKCPHLATKGIILFHLMEINVTIS